MSKESILSEFARFTLGQDGIGGWLGPATDARVFDRLDQLNATPLTKVQLNQLLAFGHEAPVSDDFFRYYWLSAPGHHPYDVTAIPEFAAEWTTAKAILSLPQLRWGLYRLYADALLWFGNVRTAYRQLRAMDERELEEFFLKRRFDTVAIRDRGPPLSLEQIPKDDRYLISEMACKSYGDDAASTSELKDALVEMLKTHLARGGKTITIKKLLEGDIARDKFQARQQEFLFSATDVLEESVSSVDELNARYVTVAARFIRARRSALANTQLYLSMVNDLDVYVATSMRARQDFRDMATDCEKIFGEMRLSGLNLRYFDPTLSAAAGHEDKGLIECLMVKCAKVLVYCAGERESYGKDAEAAMALSMGKPVIFYCTHEQRRRFYRDVHPLSRLIEFRTGVAVGAIVTDSLSEVSELLFRIFENRMEYELEHAKPGYLRLKEKLTGSCVRLQTNDRMLSETFWNHYHNRDAASAARSL